ncbi:hypothetical protein TTHERM_000854231 (macronuclear) [Tetrahymena thermophila SB210]|uniref:Uncharacterized protein n=1 Tax=Tetrahymena thermophila (strain SB210) TaxID=312017 RepID=W7XK76_TETTS|nr:hypothetical protein TTHERM_000854231 [Tetrahymena thermophila SB210]EWS74664.1 hypothetical protein TTHERM_000854231 [Tetrahymena thermophila SB210]|eukprot:XP_012652790.1 hypothetical protein TTHERM_000854231 [Tetrahymena thermophila SB210]
MKKMKYNQTQNLFSNKLINLIDLSNYLQRKSKFKFNLIKQKEKLENRDKKQIKGHKKIKQGVKSRVSRLLEQDTELLVDRFIGFKQINKQIIKTIKGQVQRAAQSIKKRKKKWLYQKYSYFFVCFSFIYKETINKIH